MRVIWDKIGERFYETGVDRTVLYTRKEDNPYGKGTAWSGVSSINENPSGAEPTPVYADNIKYLNMMSAEELGLTIEAYCYPDEFGECDGSAQLASGVTVGQQARKTFGLSYRTLIGNDTDNNDHGYKLHLVYGATASPSERSYSTVNDSPETQTMSWEIATTPVDVPGLKPTALITIDSTKVDKTKLAALEAILYGTDGTSEGSGGTDARLPMPAELIELFKDNGSEIDTETSNA